MLKCALTFNRYIKFHTMRENCTFFFWVKLYCFEHKHQSVEMIPCEVWDWFANNDFRYTYARNYAGPLTTERNPSKKTHIFLKPLCTCNCRGRYSPSLPCLAIAFTRFTAVPDIRFYYQDRQTECGEALTVLLTWNPKPLNVLCSEFPPALYLVQLSTTVHGLFTTSDPKTGLFEKPTMWNGYG